MQANPAIPGLWYVLGDEGFRLFFVLGAVHAALWPFLWVVAYGFDLPLSRDIPPSLWHVHEMVIGSFGAALIGFITTAAPDWTGTQPLRGRTLFILAAFWGTGRIAGLVGADALHWLAVVADLVWLGFLAFYIAQTSLRRSTTRLVALLLWIVCLFAGDTLAHYAFHTISDNPALAQRAVHLLGIVFLGLLGVALARVTTPITNLVLDPSAETSPYRPHPGRVNLAPILVALLTAAELTNLSSAITGYLFIAAGAAFLDRVAEAFIGREAARAEILALAGSAAFAGAGLLLVGMTRLGLPIAESAGKHLAFMGGLGLGVLAVFSIAGLRHTGQPLGLSTGTRVALLLLCASVLLRVLSESVPFLSAVHGSYALVSVLWGATFLIWLREYWPCLTDAETLRKHQH